MTKIPATVSRIEIEDESSWIIIPNGVHETKKLNVITQNQIKLDNMSAIEKEKLLLEFKEVI